MRAVSPSTAVATPQMATVGCDKTTIPSLSGIHVSLSYYKIVRKRDVFMDFKPTYQVSGLSPFSASQNLAFANLHHCSTCLK